MKKINIVFLGITITFIIGYLLLAYLSGYTETYSFASVLGEAFGFWLIWMGLPWLIINYIINRRIKKKQKGLQKNET